MKKRLAILGSTGSIGENAIRVVKHLAGEFEVTGVVARQSVARLGQQARELGCRWAITSDPALQGQLASIPSSAFCTPTTITNAPWSST